MFNHPDDQLINIKSIEIKPPIIQGLLIWTNTGGKSFR